MIEVIFMGFLTASCFYGVVAMRRDGCKPVGTSESGGESEEIRFSCPEGEYNPLATLIFNTEGGTIRQFFKYPEII